MLSDIEIANAAEMRHVTDVARDTLGIEEKHLVPYGHHKAKVDLGYLSTLADQPDGRLVLVTAISPTPAGEGKTTTTVGLTDALSSLGHRAVACLREPSMGPVFGMKGGAAGGGYAQVVPMTDINLHFTGDFAAIAAANNLLAALIDNHVHHGNALGLDVRTVTWKRVLDLNDRALRDVVVGLGGVGNGYPRQDGFDIVVASEIMAIFCLTESLADLKQRIGDIVVGYTREKRPVTARDLEADGAMAVLLRDALAPNLVQTLEHSPAFVHGGPFANIAHGCSSVMATRAGLRLGDIVVTEAGFGADLGAEKFVDIKCRKSGLRPDAAVVVATVRALKYHGGVAVADLQTEDVAALERGMDNLRRHLRNIREVYGLRAVVAVNRFPSDTDAEMDRVVELVAAEGVRAFPATHFADGGVGAQALAQGLLEVLDEPGPEFGFTYDDDQPLAAKVEAVATRLYGADGVSWDAKARRRLERIEADGYGHLPVCVAKTQYSFSTDATMRGAPSGHTLHVREVRLSAGAGFVVLVCGDVMTMPEQLVAAPEPTRLTFSVLLAAGVGERRFGVMTQTRDFVLGMFVGAAVGAAVAILYAPQSGPETRDYLRTQSGELKGKASTAVDTARTKARDLADNVSTSARDLAGNVTTSARDLAGNVTTSASQLVDTVRSSAETKVTAGKAAVDAAKQAFQEKQAELDHAGGERPRRHRQRRRREHHRRVAGVAALERVVVRRSARPGRALLFARLEEEGLLCKCLVSCRGGY